jgi:hypothetical protein
MKAEWDDEVDENICLCCMQLTSQRVNRVTPEEAAKRYELLEAIGYTRESLLNKHRAQLDYQMPGMAQWLEGQ